MSEHNDSALRAHNGSSPQRRAPARPVPEVEMERLIMLAEMGRDQDLREALAETHPADIADLMEAVEDLEARRRILSLLDPPRAGAVLSLVDEALAEQLLAAVPEAKLRDIVAALDSDDAADLLAELPRERVDAVLRAIPARLSRQVETLLQYPEESAGGIMQAEVVAVNADLTVQQATDELRRRAREVKDVHTVFAVDSEGRLVGSLPVSRLILAPAEARVATVMDREVLSVPASMDQEEVASLFKRYDLITLPVTAPDGRLLGRITIDDIVDVLDEEASEDFYRLAGLNKDERALGPIRESVRRRLPWLLGDLITCVLAASVVALFQGTIRTVAIAAAFMTMVAREGGDAGTQTLTVVVRGLATGELTLANARRLLLKETGAGLVNGLLVGIVAGLVAYIWNGEAWIGIVLAAAMVLNLFVAALVGSLVPLGLRAARIDPAIASGMLVTTFTDVCGFFTFLGLAALTQKTLGLG